MHCIKEEFLLTEIINVEKIVEANGFNKKYSPYLSEINRKLDKKNFTTLGGILGDNNKKIWKTLPWIMLQTM